MSQTLLELAKLLDDTTIKSTWGKYPPRRYNKHIIKAILRNKKKGVFIKYITSVFDTPASTIP
jgi:hypothetical protein